MERDATCRNDGIRINEECNPDYRLALVSALAETAEVFVTITELSVRGGISEMATKTASKTDTPYKGYLERISEAFKSQTCGVLCSIQAR